MKIASAKPFRVPMDRAAAYPGDVFGSITVCGIPFYAERRHGGRRQYIVGLCGACGKHFLVSCESLLAGQTKTCGCVKMVHGGAGTKLYATWQNMIARCENSRTESFAYYGARGISVCEEWHDFVAFREWANQNQYEDGLRIERVDNDGNYEPSNCRFVTQLENMNNTRRTHLITAFGETKSVARWSRDSRCVVPSYTLASRVRAGCDPEKAITTPAMTFAKPLTHLTAFGERKSIAEWVSDPRCCVDETALRARVRNLKWSHEKAISQPISESQKRAVSMRRKRRKQRLARAKATPKKKDTK